MSNAWGAMPIDYVPVDSTGAVIERILTEDGSTLDLSAASGSLYFHAKDEEGTAVTTDGAASWTTDGSDGKIRFALTSTEVGTVRDLICEFEVQGYGGGNVVSFPFILRVLPRAKVS